MNTTSITNVGATPRSTWTPAASDPDTLTAAKTLQRVDTATKLELCSIFGPSLRGIVPAVFDEDGDTPISQELRLVMSPRGPVGFIIGNEVVVDYSTPHNGAFLYSTSNLALATSLPEMPGEEELARHIAGVDLSEGMMTALAQHHLEWPRIPMIIAAKVARGVVNECLANAIPAELQGHLNLLRSFPPTIRFNLIEALLAGPNGGAIRDLLLACPLLALMPGVLEGYAGRKPKEVLKELGLPPAARKIKPRALSPIRLLMPQDGGDIDLSSIRWMTQEVLAALPPNSLLQLKLFKLAYVLLLDGMSQGEVAERLAWAAQHAGTLFARGAPSLDDWLRSSPELLDRAAIRKWNSAISPQHALEAAAASAEAHKLLDDPHMADTFKLPSWAFPRPLPRSRWTLRPISNQFDLVAAGRRNQNCAALLGEPCRVGTKVIVEITRPVRDPSALPKVGDHEIGAMAEIVSFCGYWKIVQCRGFANGDPASSALRAVKRLVDEVNATEAEVWA